MSLFFDYTQEQIIAMIDILDRLHQNNYHLLEANPKLRYAPFEYNHLVLRDVLWNSLTPYYQEEWKRRKELVE